jgi:hypothetical protein
MAMDLYAGEHTERIGTPEERLLDIAAGEPARYPQLGALHDKLYASPRIAAPHVAAVLHELLMLLQRKDVQDTPYLLKRGLALAAFFSTAARLGLEVRTASD